MNLSLKWFITFLTITVAIAALTIPMRLKAQNQAAEGHHHYKLIDLGTLGGPNSYLNPGSGELIGQFARVLNERGTVVGLANASSGDPFPNFCFDLEGDCFLTHAFRTRDETTLIDLHDLRGGGGSAATWIADNGLIAGVSRNGEIDPLFSTPEFPAIAEMRAVLWKNDEIMDLGMLPEGGYESYAAAVNSAGQAVGAATNKVPDVNSMAAGTFWLGNIGYPYQTRAFIWQKGEGMTDLGALPGGSDSQAILINEAGQVIGYSYTGSGPSSPLCPFPLVTGSFIWEPGTGVKDLGNLGGTCTLANDINQRGEIVGSALLTGDQAQHAFLWRNGTIQDLGGSLGGDFTGAFALNEAGNAVGFAYLQGDAAFHAALWEKIGDLTDLGVIGSDLCSYAAAINSHAQVVGSSLATCDADTGAVRAILWENGSLFDLNTLIPSDSALQLGFTQTINERGEIAGTGSDIEGNQHAFLLIPCDGNHPGIDGCDYSLVDAPAVEIATRSDPFLRDPSLANPALATSGPSSQVQRFLGGANSPINGMFRSRLGLARAPRTRQASALTAISTTSLTITSGAPPSGTVGQPYGPFQFLWRLNIFTKIPVHFFQMSASGGSGSYSGHWAAAPGSSLPPGLACCELILEHTFPGPVGGEAFYYPVIHGQPTAAGTYHVVVTLTDNNSALLHASAIYSITISP
jgi:probable HAF family extracellular repeat protein